MLLNNCMQFKKHVDIPIEEIEQRVVVHELRTVLGRMGVAANPHLAMNYDRSFLGEDSGKNHIIVYEFNALQKSRTGMPNESAKEARLLIKAAFDVSNNDIVPSTLPLLIGENINKFERLEVHHKDYNEERMSCKFKYDANVD
tara:strand:+ start:3154 stop:3582 length:429 start_codon:yes stop_codon:yes gene_type:complete